MTAPDRTAQQRTDALDKANYVRLRRAKYKRDLKGGRVKLSDMVREPKEWAETMKVIDCLLALPKFGDVKAGKFFGPESMSTRKTLGGLSERQRKVLLSKLEAMGQ